MTAHPLPVHYQLRFPSCSLGDLIDIALDKAHLGSIRNARLDGGGHKSSYFEYLSGLIGNWDHAPQLTEWLGHHCSQSSSSQYRSFNPLSF